MKQGGFPDPGDAAERADEHAQENPGQKPRKQSKVFQISILSFSKRLLRNMTKALLTFYHIICRV